MRDRNSLLKIALIVVLHYTKEGRATNSNAAVAEICSLLQDCNGSTPTPEFCRCDETCSLYGDCCPNAPNITANASQPFECSSSSKVYMISRCPNNVDAVLKEMCEGDPMPNEISLDIPATDVASGITYRNYYCAVCNGAEENSTVLWDTRFNCHGSLNIIHSYNRSELGEMIHFDNNIGRWGVWDTRSSERIWGIQESIFHPCDLFSHRPSTPDFAHAVHDCIPGMSSRCSANWNDTEVEKRCHSLHAPVFYYRSVSYKNIYCAMCNYVPLSDIKCYPVDRRRGMDYPPPFTILVNFNSADEQSRCREGEVRFNNECRELSCGFPHFVRINGKCVPKG